MPEYAQEPPAYYRQLTLVASLIFATVVCAGLLALRMAYTRGLMYVGLLWNLFLAWLPLVSSLAAYNLYRRWYSLTTILVLASALIWLLFFPNAPYLLTDLMHLKASDVPLWYDLILLVAFAWTGSFLGHVSLYLMQCVVQRVVGPLLSWVFALGTLGLGSLGIYLGRFLRWNSWDIFTRPGEILTDIWEFIRHPFAHLEVIAFSVLFYLFLVASYWMLVTLTQFAREQPANETPQRLPRPTG
ncbi:MAG: DUF1361 domain-containing protein [Anaerolineae bacterium]|nr:DUF1361 domain-containing protein [Anaerolineae bacterium]